MHSGPTHGSAPTQVYDTMTYARPDATQLYDTMTYAGADATHVCVTTTFVGADPCVRPEDIELKGLKYFK